MRRTWSEINCQGTRAASKPSASTRARIATSCALVQAYRFGMEKAKATLDAALDTAEQLLIEAGRKADEVRQELMDHAARYVSTIIDSMIATIRPVVTIGTRNLQLDGIDLAQSVSLSGSLRIAITDIASFTADGRLTVNARYRTAGPAKG